MKKILSYILAAAVVSACIYPYEQKLEETERPIIAVEGDILPGGTTVVYLSYLQSLYASTSHRPVTYPSGTAWVEDDAGGKYPATSFELTQTSYSLIIPTQGVPSGHKVRLVLSLDGETFVSDWLESRKPPVMKDIVFSADENQVYVAATIGEGEVPTGYLAVTYEETWRFHADYGCMYEINPVSWTVLPLMNGYPNYYCWMSAKNINYTLIDCSENGGAGVTEYVVQKFSRYNNRNHERYSIKVDARVLSEEEYRFRKNIENNSEISGDLFTPNPGELAGNLRCESNPDVRILGYVSASEVSSMRKYLSSQYLLPRLVYYAFVIPEPEEYESYYYKGWRPVDIMTVDDKVGIAWGPLRCIDCVEAGGTKTRPDFWED